MSRMITLPEYVQPIKAGGKTYYYLRYRGQNCGRLPDPSDKGFKAAYKDALDAAKQKGEATVAGHAAAKASAKAKKNEASEHGALRAALDAYLKDGININKRDGSEVAPATVTLRRALLENWHRELDAKFGSVALSEFTSDVIEDLIRKTARAGNVGKARNLRTALRSFFDYCKTTKLVEADPSITLNVKLPKASEDGYRMWGDEQIALYFAKHPPGSDARYMYDLFYSSGAACVDLCRLSRKNIVDGYWEYTRQKTGEDACKPISPEMMAQIEQRTAAMGNVVPLSQPLLLHSGGQPFSPSLLSERLRDYAAQAGIETPDDGKGGFSAHGIRKRACCDDLDRGDCSFDELMAMYGWTTTSMVTHYGKKYSRRNAARRVALRRGRQSVNQERLLGPEA